MFSTYAIFSIHVFTYAYSLYLSLQSVSFRLASLCAAYWQRYSSDGIIIARTIYSITPGNAAENIASTAYNALTTVGSIPKYSATPPQTPQIFLSDDFFSLFSISVKFFF